MSRIEVNGVGLNVETVGDGPPLLLLHGFTGSNRTWQSHLPTLAARHRLIAVEMLGHGDSDAPDEPGRYDLVNVAADLVALLAWLGIKQTALLGYSMGGRVALHFALHQPHMVSRLLLESATPGLTDPAERAARVESDNALADFVEEAGITAFVDRWESLPLWNSQRSLPEQVWAEVRQQRLANRPVGLANSLRGLGTGVQVPLWDQLATLSLPTLLIVGELDSKFSGIARRMAPLLPTARLAIVAQAGHAVHLEQPTEFDRLVLDFLDE